jgi:hypothetical protein
MVARPDPADKDEQAMSKKDHPVKNQLKADAHRKPTGGGSSPGGGTNQNELADTPLNPREQGKGHQRQP